MKHVFWIHSHSLYLTALGVMNTLHLPSNDVIFLLKEHYKCYSMPQGIHIYDLSDIDDLVLRRDSQKIIADKIKLLDKFIEENIGEKYTFYIPHFLPKLWQIIATNKLCVDIKFVQEGIIDYCKGDGRNKKLLMKTFFTKVFLRNFGRVWQDYASFWDFRPLGVRKVSESFALSEGLYNKLDCKHTIIKWPKIEVPLKLEEDGVFFVFDSLSERYNIERRIYLQATENMIKRYAGVHNYVKFHPIQSKANQEYIKSLFTKYGYKVKVLPNEVPFEIILTSQAHMKVCGFTSSLVFFAALMPQHEAHICVETLYSSRKFVDKYWKVFKGHLIRCYGSDTFNFEPYTINDLKPECANKVIADALYEHSYARIDVKNEGGSDNNVDIIEISDPIAKVDTPKWMHHNGSGRVIKSSSGMLDMQLRCRGKGKLIINLLAADFRTDNATRIPIWVYYTKFIVDDKIVFNTLKPACHAQRQNLVIDSEDNKIVNVHIEWVPGCAAYGSGVNKIRKMQEEEVNAAKVRDIENVSYARVDIKNRGADDNDIKILELSDKNAQVVSPSWMHKDGNGRVVKSSAGHVSLKVKCKGSGVLGIDLRGPDIRDSENKRVPIWINYTKFSVDNKVILNTVKPIWHDGPIKFSLNVEDGQVVAVNAEWLTDYIVIGHSIGYAGEVHKEILKSIQTGPENVLRLTESLKSLNKKLEEADAAIAKRDRQLTDIRSGISFKLGRLLTYIPRKILGKS